MKLFKVSYNLGSAVASDWQADTIFGHLCWALRYLEGEDELLQFLGEYRRQQPRLVISNGFPSDLLPRPITPPIRPAPHGTVKEQLDRFTEEKGTKRIGLLSLEEFEEAIQGKGFVPTSRGKHLPWKRVTLKNRIGRETGSTGKAGELFGFEETVWARRDTDIPKGIPVSIYVSVRNGFEEQAERLFAFIAAGGYGRRKSAGYGQIKSWSFDEFQGFHSPPDANGFVSLSNFVPAEGDPTEGTWQTVVKYGKLGENFAAAGNPFKKPVLMLAAGSTFVHAPCKEHYGRVVGDVARRTDADVVQYGFALPVPMKITG